MELTEALATSLKQRAAFVKSVELKLTLHYNLAWLSGSELCASIALILIPQSIVIVVDLGHASHHTEVVGVE